MSLQGHHNKFYLERSDAEFQVFIKTLSGKTISLDVRYNDTIENVKFRIFCREGVPVCSQRLLFNGRQLGNNEVLKSCQVKHGSMFHLTMRLIGGGPKRKNGNTKKRVEKEVDEDLSSVFGGRKRDEYNTLAETLKTEEGQGLDRKMTTPVNTKGLSSPTFNGEANWAAFIEQFGDVAEFAGWSEVEKLVRLKTGLRGKAADWLPTVAPEKKKSFEALVTAMAERFDRSTLFPDEARRTLLQRKQRRDEGLSELASDIENLARMAYGGLGVLEDSIQKLAVSHFLEAIEDSRLRLQILLARPLTISTALIQARELERIFVGEGKQNSIRVLQSESRNNSDIQSDGVDRIITEMRRLHRMTGNDKGSVFQGDQRTCFRCQQKGHLADRCTQNKSLGISSDQAFGVVKCFGCGKEGHRRWECPSRSKWSGNERGGFAGNRDTPQGI